jgi:hypothetical protein
MNGFDGPTVVAEGIEQETVYFVIVVVRAVEPLALHKAVSEKPSLFRSQASK